MGELLTEEDLADLRTVAVEGLNLRGVGGDTWSVEGGSGDGISGPVTMGAAGTITGYVAQDRPASLVVALPGTSVPAAPWRLTLVSGTVAAGSVITSTDDPTIQFTVRKPEPGVLYPTAIVEPL